MKVIFYNNYSPQDNFLTDIVGSLGRIFLDLYVTFKNSNLVRNFSRISKFHDLNLVYKFNLNF